MYVLFVIMLVADENGVRAYSLNQNILVKYYRICYGSISATQGEANLYNEIIDSDWQATRISLFCSSAVFIHFRYTKS